MAQLGNTQREPSMEEILASIRRIIEDSDIQKPDEAVLSVRPDNDARPAAVEPEVTAVAATSAVVTEDARFADYEPYSPVSDEAAVAPMAVGETSIVPAAANEDSVIAAFEIERKLAGTVFSDASKSVDLQTEESAHAPQAESASAVDLVDWRLGVSDEAVINQLSEEDFDLAEVADAVLQELSSDQSIVVAAAAAPVSVREDAPVLSLANNNELGRSSIISDHAGRQVTAAFNELAEAFAARSRKSLEEVAEEMMRPMLQDWLDNNLPTLVERLVREEIERVARGADA